MTEDQKVVKLDEAIGHLYTVLVKLSTQAVVSVVVDGATVTYKSMSAVRAGINALESQKRALQGPVQIKVRSFS